MQTLILNGSPRDNGTSAQLSFFVHSLTNGERLQISDYKIKACTGCESCKKSGFCVLQDDDMILFYTAIQNTKKIIIISPIYFFGMPSHFKALIDRTQVFWHHPLPPDKNILILLHGERANTSFIECYRKSFEYISSNWGCPNPEFVFFPEVIDYKNINLSLVKTHLIRTKEDNR